MAKALVLDDRDNVANLIGPGSRGELVTCDGPGQRNERLELREDIPPNHKCARRNIRRGEPVIKYGLCIGKAVCDIPAGAHVHVHNVESNRGRGDLMTKAPAGEPT